MLTNPDFPALARAFGADAHVAESPDQLRAALGTALAADRPALVHVPMPLDPAARPGATSRRRPGGGDYRPSHSRSSSARTSAGSGPRSTARTTSSTCAALEKPPSTVTTAGTDRVKR